MQTFMNILSIVGAGVGFGLGMDSVWIGIGASCVTYAVIPYAV